MSGMSIGEICDETGLSPRTVRYYEELGLLPGVRRRNGGRRVYGPDELERLGFIQRLKKLGLTLSQIGDLNAVYAIAGSTHQMLVSLDQVLFYRLDELESHIDELSDLRDDIRTYCDHVRSRRDQLAAEQGAAPRALGQSA